MRRHVIVLACLVIAALVVPVTSTASPRQQSVLPRQDSRFLNPNLVQVAQVSGSIQDFSGTRVLYLDSSSGSPTMKVRDRGTGVDTTLPRVPGRQIAQGWLTPSGVFLRTSHNRLYEWTGGDGLTDLGTCGTVLIRGSYAAWGNATSSNSTFLYSRDFTTGQTVEVARARDLGQFRKESFVLGDLATNGDVVYSGAVIDFHFHAISVENWIRRYHNGVTEEIVGDDPKWTRWSPISDGTTTVYRKSQAMLSCPGCGPHAVALHDGTREFDLTSLMPIGAPPNPGSDYDVAGGWAAYALDLDEGAGQTGVRMQVWRRGPDGTLDKMAETADRRLSIVSLGTDGVVLYSVAPYGGPASLYLSEVGQPPILLASGWGSWTSRYGSPGLNFAKRIDGRWHLAIGGTLYALAEGPRRR